MRKHVLQVGQLYIKVSVVCTWNLKNYCLSNYNDKNKSQKEVKLRVAGVQLTLSLFSSLLKFAAPLLLLCGYGLFALLYYLKIWKEE